MSRVHSCVPPPPTHTHHHLTTPLSLSPSLAHTQGLPPAEDRAGRDMMREMMSEVGTQYDGDGDETMTMTMTMTPRTNMTSDYGCRWGGVGGGQEGSLRWEDWHCGCAFMMH